MRIIYERLTIENFKGVLGARVIEFSPTLTHILGANHTGKTTTADAVHWLLFNKNSEGATNFGIDPKDGDGNIIHKLDNRVKLELTADGRGVVLEKVRREVWTKPKQQEQERLDSHTTLYFVNGEKYTQKDFNAYIGGLIGEGLFRAITNPAYFPTLKPEDQRTLLVKMVGEKSPEEIAGDREDFKGLLRVLQGTDLKAFRESLSYKIKELKKEIETIPSRIAEHENELAGLAAKGTDFEAVRRQIDEVEKEISVCDQELADRSRIIDADFEARSQDRIAITRLKKRQQEIIRSYQDKNTQAQRRHDDEVRDAQRHVESLAKDIEWQTSEQSRIKRKLGELEVQKQDFRKRWAEVEAGAFVWDSSKETCPTCGQRLPEGDIERMKDEAEERFNTRKAQRQDALDNEGRELKATQDAQDALLRTSEEKARELHDKLDTAREYLDGAKSQQVGMLYYSDNEEYQQLEAEIKERTAKLEESADGDGGTRTEMADIRNRKAELNRRRDGLRDLLPDEKTMAGKKERIRELEGRQTQLNQQLTDLERQEYTAGEFGRAVIEDLQNRVNDMFANVKFEMFRTLINGNSEPTCVLTMHGTPYQDLSNSEKINAGIECINVMCRFNDTYAPLFVDNSESVNDVTPTESQQILLVVSRDKELTVIA